MDDVPNISNVLVTGGTGFVGRYIVRGLLARGFTPVCLVRSPEKLRRQLREISGDRYVTVAGDISSRKALREAAGQCEAAIHLVGIIMDKWLRGQTFHRVHVRGTTNVVEACKVAGVRRFVHMSALGARDDGPAAYQRTKWEAEQIVAHSGMEWTIFRPSIIHEADGEFMQLMKQFMCGLVPPVIPYFGSGKARLQPVSVKDVAYGFCKALTTPDSVGQIVPLGGPQAYSWVELYELCRRMIPCAKSWKPLASMPVPIAKLAAGLSRVPLGLAEMVSKKAGMMRFNSGQVDMAQEDSVCDHTIAEKLFGMTMRDFEVEFASYADRI